MVASVLAEGLDGDLVFLFQSKNFKKLGMVLAIATLACSSSCTNFKKMYMIMGSDPVADPQAAIVRGETIYKNNCVACHGKTGLGDGPTVAQTGLVPADLRQLATQKSVKTFAANIYYGKGEGMEAFGDQLTEEQIWDVAHFVKSFGKE